MGRDKLDARICIITNPYSGRGKKRTLKTVSKYAHRYFTAHEVWHTQYAGHATVLAQKALLDGFDIVAAYGGDGTAHEVVNGFFDNGELINPRSAFALIPGGSGNDLTKSLRVPTNIKKALAVAAYGTTVHHDVMHIDYHDHDGAPQTKVSLNVTGYGMNGEVVRRANNSGKRFGGKLAYLKATLGALRSYKHPHVSLNWTDAEGNAGSWEGPLLSTFIANAHYCGGGMHVGKNGSMQDGTIDVTIIPKLSLPRVLFSSHRLYSGKMHKTKGVTTQSVVTLEARVVGDTSVLVDIDGEQPGTLPLYMRVASQILPIRVPHSK